MFEHRGAERGFHHERVPGDDHGNAERGRGTGLAEAFLREANKRRAFGVVVAESAPGYQGHATAKSLTERGVRDVTVICDSAVYAMPRRQVLRVERARRARRRRGARE